MNFGKNMKARLGRKGCDFPYKCPKFERSVTLQLNQKTLKLSNITHFAELDNITMNLFEICSGYQNKNFKGGHLRISENFSRKSLNSSRASL